MPDPIHSLTAEHLGVFRRAIQRYVKYYGLLNWHVEVYSGESTEALAWVRPAVEAHRADVYLATTWDEEPTEKRLLDKARHEVLHIVVADLSHAGGKRYVSESELNEAEEQLVLRLMSITRILPERRK